MGSNIEHDRQIHSLRCHPLAQRFARDELGDNKVQAVYLSDLMNGDDVRMIEGGSRLGFLLKASQPIRVRSEFCGQQLERDLAFQTSVFRQINLTHPARPQQREDVVMA